MQHRGHSFETMIPCHCLGFSSASAKKPTCPEGYDTQHLWGKHVSQEASIAQWVKVLGHSWVGCNPILPHPHPILCRCIPRTATRGQPLHKMTETVVALALAIGAIGGGRLPGVGTRGLRD